VKVAAAEEVGSLLINTAFMSKDGIKCDEPIFRRKSGLSHKGNLQEVLWAFLWSCIYLHKHIVLW
jgi:hypothetical protein